MWIAAWLALVSRGLSCGISWTVPVTHFDGVDEKGHVCYSQKIGEVDFGNDLKLPLIINFRSDRESSSPYLGKGWILALLDSRFVQTGENAFQMTQPDGWVRPFYRGKANDPVLDGGDWKAEIKGDRITAWTGCGWKLIYSKGRLLSIGTPKNRQLELVYSGHKAVELRENGATRLAVEFDQASGQARALAFNGKRLMIAQDQKPRVQVMAGKNVIGGMDQSLRQISGVAEQFEFAANDKVQPTLKITGTQAPERLFGWDAGTKLITKDGEWSYQVTPAKALAENAAIGRKNAQGENEYWFNDGARGREITQGVDGIRKTTTCFTSGKLRGKTRKEESMKDNVTLKTYQASYDDAGHLIRHVWLSDGKRTEETFDFDADGRSLAAYRDGKKLWSNTWQNGKLIGTKYENGKDFKYTYHNDGAVEEVFTNVNGEITKKLITNGLVTRVISPGGTIKR